MRLLKLEECDAFGNPRGALWINPAHVVSLWGHAEANDGPVTVLHLTTKRQDLVYVRDPLRDVLDWLGGIG